MFINPRMALLGGYKCPSSVLRHKKILPRVRLSRLMTLPECDWDQGTTVTSSIGVSEVVWKLFGVLLNTHELL